MSKPNDDARLNPTLVFRIVPILTLALLVFFTPSPASAGAIRPGVRAKARTMAGLQKSSANPWGAYWKAALQYRWKDVHGPRAVTMLKVSSDGTVPDSPFVQYLSWRQSLNVKRFNTFHPELVQMLRRVKPSTIPPLTTPILPPDFTPITPVPDTNLPQGLNPPQVPEPATGVMALLMIGSAVMARRWSRSGPDGATGPL